MKKKYRVKSDADFQKVFHQGKSYANRQLVLYIYPKPGQAHFRVGISVGKKMGKAVDRNRIKRLIREALKEVSPMINQELDFLLIARSDIKNKSLDELTQSIIHVMSLAGVLDRNNDLSKNYWEKNLAGFIIEHSLSLYGVEYEPIFMVVIKEAPLKGNTASVLDLAQEEKPPLYLAQSELNPKYTFENFVVGKDNDLASAAAMTVADSPGLTYNPLLIYGGVGLGKTHLMQAIGNEIRRKNPDTIIRYATSEAFMNDFVTSIQNKSTNEFRKKYRNVDVLLVDDIQFLSNKDQTQEEFFHTFNALFDRQKQIVLTSDRLPNNINNLEERLISRFKWGLSTDIAPPDLETRIAILRKKASNDNIDIRSDVLTYIANNINTNIRELEGALIRVFAYATIHGEEITIHLASQALQSIVDGQEDRPISPDEIIRTVASEFALNPEAIKGKKRTKNIVEPRQIAMYLTRELTNLSFPKIGEAFGNRNHTTVIHAYDKIAGLIHEDPDMSRQVNLLKKKLED